MPSNSENSPVCEIICEKKNLSYVSICMDPFPGTQQFLTFDKMRLLEPLILFANDQWEEASLYFLWWGWGGASSLSGYSPVTNCPSPLLAPRHSANWF